MDNRSRAEVLATAPPEVREAFIAELSPADAEALLNSWDFLARQNQKPPPGDWYGWLIRSGRGGGKTRTGAEWVHERARDYPHEKIALVAATPADARDTMVELGESSILKIAPRDFVPLYEPSKRRLTWPNGATGVVYSGAEPDQLRGPGHGSAWVDELAKFKYPDMTWDNLEFILREAADPQIVVTTTPRPIPIIKKLEADPDFITTVYSTYENRSNVSGRWLKRLLDKYEGTTLADQELHGKIIEEVEGALFARAHIEKGRLPVAPEMDMIVIGVDPATTAKKSSDETGIIVVGRGVERLFDDRLHFYVLDDLSMRARSGTWADAIKEAYEIYNASMIIAESNQGGDLVEDVIRSARYDLPVELRPAIESKAVRAEPVSLLYQQGRVHHVGNLALLEDQMTTWLPNIPGQPSPDRMDALVWAITYLNRENDFWVA